MNANWLEDAYPVDYEIACIPNDAYGPLVIYDELATHLTSLACWQDFKLDEPNTYTRCGLELDDNSFVMGDLEIRGDTSLTVHTRIYVGGELKWKEGKIAGAGVTDLGGGMSLTGNSVSLHDGKLNLGSGLGRSSGP